MMPDDFTIAMLLLVGWYLREAFYQLTKPDPDGYFCHTGPAIGKDTTKLE